MLVNTKCFKCDSEHLISVGFDTLSYNDIEVEELQCKACGFVTKIPLQNKSKLLRKSIENLTHD